MRNKRSTLLLHPLFLLSVFLLLLNDFYLKYYLHNWFTGKLSDFAGLFAFAVFFFELVPNYKGSVAIITALLFVWWKSTLSDSVINLLNCHLYIPINRIKDYSDLSALVILPLSFSIKPITIHNSFFKRLLKYCVAFIAFSAFTATSLPRRLADDNKILLDKHIKTKKNEGEILKTFKDNGLRPVSAPIYEKKGHYKYYLRPKNSKDLNKANP